MKQDEDIFDIALSIYKDKSVKAYDYLADLSAPLPFNVEDLLELAASESQARLEAIKRYSVKEEPFELFNATAFFIQAVLLPSDNAHRVLGLREGATLEQIEKNHELIKKAFFDSAFDITAHWNADHILNFKKSYTMLVSQEKERIEQLRSQRNNVPETMIISVPEKSSAEPKEAAAKVVPETIIVDLNKLGQSPELDSESEAEPNKQEIEKPVTPVPETIIIDSAAVNQAFAADNEPEEKLSEASPANDESKLEQESLLDAAEKAPMEIADPVAEQALNVEAATVEEAPDIETVDAVAEEITENPLDSAEGESPVPVSDAAPIEEPSAQQKDIAAAQDQPAEHADAIVKEEPFIGEFDVIEQEPAFVELTDTPVAISDTDTKLDLETVDAGDELATMLVENEKIDKKDDVSSNIDDDLTIVRMALPKWGLLSHSKLLGTKMFPVIDTLMVGRHSSSDVVLPVSEVSRQHAEIKLDNEQLFVRDLGSTNGTFINGDKVESGWLKAGDRISFDELEFEVISLGKDDASTQLRQIPTKKEAAVEKAEVIPPSHPVELRGVSGPVDGQTYRLDKDRLTVGRSKKNDIIIKDSTISSVHAELLKDKDGWHVRDLDSLNGVYINGKKRVDGLLKAKDNLRFGRVVLELA